MKTRFCITFFSWSKNKKTIANDFRVHVRDLHAVTVIIIIISYHRTIIIINLIIVIIIMKQASIHIQTYTYTFISCFVVVSFCQTHFVSVCLCSWLRLFCCFFCCCRLNKFTDILHCRALHFCCNNANTNNIFVCVCVCVRVKSSTIATKKRKEYKKLKTLAEGSFSFSQNWIY